MNPAKDFWAFEIAGRYLSMAREDLVVKLDMEDMVGNIDMVERLNIVDIIDIIDMMNMQYE
jgi:hypothetical protein